MGYKMSLKCLLVALVMVGMATYFYTIMRGSHLWIITILTGFLSAICLSMSIIIFDVIRHNPADSHSIESLAIQYLAYVAFKIGGRFIYQRLLKLSQSVQSSQEEILYDIITSNICTEYGKQHDFEELSDNFDREEFRAKQPITSYSDYAGYIDQISNGEDDVLTSDPVLYLATTSGTSGYRKLIPITDHMRDKTGKDLGMMMCYLIHCKAPLKLGRVLMLSYMPALHESPCGLTIGPVSYHMSRYLPFTTSPRPVYQIANERAALYIHAVFALMETEVSHVEGIFSSLVFSFWKTIEQRWQEICHTIETGIIPTDLEINDNLLEEIREEIKVNPKRSEQLREVFKGGMENIAKRLWPGLRSVRMLSTGSFEHQAGLVTLLYMNDVVVVSQLHVMSEGFMGVDTQTIYNGLHSYTAIPFFAMLEYIRESDISEKQPGTCFVEQLSVGECYEVVLTTPMGLYRYRTGDIIEVIDHLGELPIYRYKRRTGLFLNLYWEKTTEDTFYAAVVKATNALGITIVEYAATESVNLENITDNFTGIKHYIMFVEFLKDGKPFVVAENLLTQFDKSLRESMELYNDLRVKDSIGCMRVLQVKPGTLEELKQIIMEKTQNQQFKFPRVLRKEEHLRLLLGRVQQF